MSAPIAEPASADTALRVVTRQFFRGFLFAGVITAFVNIGVMFIPLYDMQLYHRVIESHSMDTLTLLTIGTAVAMVMYGMLEGIRSWIFIIMGDRVARRLNIPALRAAIVESLAGDPNSGAQALRDLNDLRLFITGVAVALPLDLLWTPILLLVLYMLNPAYALYGVACVVALVAMSAATDAATRRRLAAANQGAARGLNGMLWTLRNTELIESMGMLPAIARRWQASQEPVLRDLARGTRHAMGFGAFARGSRMLLQAGVIALGVVLVVDHEAMPASLLGANLILTKLLVPFDQLVSGWRQWVFAIASYRRVRDLIARDARRREPDGVVVASVEGRLSVVGLSYVPPGANRPVLHDISFEVAPGEAIGIIGPSGSGKSTLARLLVGTIEPSGGSVELDGHATYRWARADFTRHVGYLPQSVSLLDGTVFENIARMSDADPEDVVEAAKRADVHTMIGRLPQGYTTPIGNGLSGGQKQRVALARALFGRPRLLVLDEPNSGLDREGEAALLRTVEAAKADGAAVVIIAHRPSALAAVDTLLVLKGGAIEHFGPREDVARALSLASPADAARTAGVDPAAVPAAVTA